MSSPMVRNANLGKHGPACLLLVLVPFLVAACQRGAADDANTPQTPARGGEAVTPKTDPVRRLDRILEMLWDQDEKVREAGMKDLTEFQKETKALGLQVGLKALRAAARPYPFDYPDPGRVSGELIALADARPLPEYIPVVVELFGRFPDDAKWRAQVLLAALESREAAEALMTIVRTHAPTGKLPSLITGRLVRKLRHPDVFFPEILKYTSSSPKLSFEIHHFCLDHCEAQLLSPAQRAALTDPILSSYRELSQKLRPAQKDQGIAWIWQDSYQDARHHAGLLLDLLGYLPADRVEKPLRDALEYRDPRLKYFALISLLRLGKAVDPKHVEDVAGSAEVRNWLYTSLKELDKSSLFPERFRTQAAFAEADMVNWLVFPTELARVPDEIELMKVVTIDTGLPDGLYDYYLFRFRTKPPHWAAEKGWIAGVSGPYLRKDEPTTKALGDTFSSFDKWDAKTPEEHVGDTRELMERWREYHSKKKD